MARHIFLIILLIFTKTAWGQLLYNQHSLDMHFGYSQPLNYFEDNFGVNLGFNHAKIGYRYMFSRSLGIRANIGFDRFKTAAIEKTTSQMNHYTLDLVYNVGRSLRIPQNTNRSFTILMHAGTGFTRHKLPQLQKTERCLPIRIGITPLMVIHKRLSITADITHVFNIKQHYRFNGVLISDSFPITGRYITVSMGMMFYVGVWDDHPDVY
jgi:OOP family OmpA-OmpF porin